FPRPLQPRTLHSFPTRRSSDLFKYEPDPVNANVEIFQRNRPLMNMLYSDAMLRGEEEDAAAAMESCRALLALARSIGDEPIVVRSEEHTSELQSLRHLVCRLLL